MAYRALAIYGPGQPTTSGAATLYTNTSGRTTWIKEAILANNSTAGAGVIAIGIGGVNSSQMIVPRLYIAGASTSTGKNNLIILALSKPLTSSGLTIQARNYTTRKVTVTLSGEANS